MKAFILVLSATSLAAALPTAIDAPGLVHLIAVASHVLPYQTPIHLIEPCEVQRSTSTKVASREVHASIITNDRGPVPNNITEITDKYLFRLPINEFEAKRDSRHPPTLDWSSDGCTKAPDDIGTWNFLPACHRHDFGLRNYREQGRLDRTAKGHIDDQFLEE